MILAETCEIFRSLLRFFQKEQGNNKCCSRSREAQLCYGKSVEEVVDQHRKLVTFEERAVAAETSFARL